jgi:tRNA threonylcarbamoyladenosine biosynthesis protein TsaB
VRILALDTATENCSAALLIDGQLTTRERLLGRGHSEHILPMIEELLVAAGVELASLTAIAFGRGPGSFTGVRLAASVTQGLAFAAGLGVVPVSDLRAVAQRLLAGDAAARRVLVCSDARMREVYWGCFERGADGLAIPQGDEQVGAPARVALPAAWTMSPGNEGLRGAGVGFAAYPQLRGIVPGQRVTDDLGPRAGEVAQLAAADVAAGRLLSPAEALPVYLRDEVAQPRDRSH